LDVRLDRPGGVSTFFSLVYDPADATPNVKLSYNCGHIIVSYWPAQTRTPLFEYE
jgi:hypothetical protein